MNGPQSAAILWYLLALVLVGSALLSRRIPMRGTLVMVLAWIGIFGFAYLLFEQGSRFLGPDSAGTASGGVQPEEVRQRVEGQSVHIALASDGHYWADGTVNGTAVRFLVDSGATVTALGEETAQRAGLNIDHSHPGLTMQTANGPVAAKPSIIPTLTIGPVRASDLPIIVSPAFGKVNVLGMNFLSQLKGWRVENGEMVLEPR